VICEECNNNLKQFSIFRNSAIAKQLSLTDFVDGSDNLQDNAQHLLEEYEDIKIKTEVAEDQNETQFAINFCPTEYLEEDANDTNSYDQTEQNELDCKFTVIKLHRSSSSSKRKHSNSYTQKKEYKRALCTLCGNSYYKDQLQRHIDVSFCETKLAAGKSLIIKFITESPL